MSGNYDKLAKHLVNFKGRTHEELVALLKERAQLTLGPRRGLAEFEPALPKESIAAK